MAEDDAPDLAVVDASSRSRLEDLSIAIHEKLADPTVERRFGRKCLAEHDQERRVVWIHAPGRYEPPKQAGPKVVGGYKVRSIYNRIEAFEAHIYAEDDGAVDVLLDYLVAAAALVEPSFSPVGFDWSSDEEHNAGQTPRTDKIVLRGTFKLPVLDQIKATRVVVSTTNTVGTIQPDDSVLPEPMS